MPIPAFPEESTAQPLRVRELLDQARAGNASAVGKLMEVHRGRLRRHAQFLLDARIAGRVDGSDVVQQSFLEAVRDFAQFRGEGSDEWHAWLERVVENNVRQLVEQHLVAGKRSALNEQAIDGSGNQQARLKASLLAADSSPSDRAMKNERNTRLEAATQNLPKDQAEVIRLRYLEGWSVTEIAAFTGRTSAAVAGLLHRALKQLRRHERRDD